MTSIGPKSIKLLPFQKEFVETVLSPSGERLVLLSAAPGMGKTYSAICATALFLAQKRDARILILAPKSIVRYWQEKLNAMDSSNVEIDRYGYRELLEKDDGHSIWPTGKVLILSRDFAKQTAIMESLDSVYWDLIVIDEVSSLRQFGHYPKQASRVVMLSYNLHTDETIPGCNLIEWEAPAKRNFQVSRITFVRSESEICLSKTLANLISLDSVSNELRLINQRILEAYNSSPLALETIVSSRIKETLIDDIPQNLKEHPLAQILNCLENLTDDEKLAAFSKVALNNLSNDLGKKSLIVANYLDTLHYLLTEIEDSGERTAILTGAASLQDREAAISSLDASGGFLLCTQTMLKNIEDFEIFERIILYDPLRNLNDQLLSRLKEADPIIIHLYSEEDFEFVYTGMDLDVDELGEIVVVDM